MDKILDFFKEDNQLSRLVKLAKQNLALDGVLKKLLPSPISNQCKAINIRDDKTLVIFANNNIVAARLSLLANCLPEQLAKLGFDITSIKINILPKTAPQKQYQEPMLVDKKITDQLIKTAQTQSDHALSKALKKLASHLAKNSTSPNG